MPMDAVDVVHPDRHPDAIVARLALARGGDKLLPRLPCAPWQRKISHLPKQTDPNVGGLPQSKPDS
jgi:hypothetical protein